MLASPGQGCCVVSYGGLGYFVVGSWTGWAVVCAILFAASPAGATSAMGPPDPLNRPVAGAQVTPNVAADQTLGVAQLAAVVTAGGNLAFPFATAGATGVVKIAAGSYEVDFNRSVAGCFYAATGYNPSTIIFVQPRDGNPNGVFVGTSNLSNVRMDSSFYLMVFCDR